MPVGDADRIRDYATKIVEAKRREGKKEVTFRAGDIHNALGLRLAHANVCQALDGRRFHEQARVKLVRYEGVDSRAGSNSYFTFEILEHEVDDPIEESSEPVSAVEHVPLGERIARLEAQVEMLIWELDEIKKDIRHLRRI